MSWVAVGTTAVSAGAKMYSDSKNRKAMSASNEPLMTPEQQQAMQWLSKLGLTGSAGGLNLGEAYGGSLGDFSMTPTEGLAGNNLFNLLGSGLPGAFGTAENTLTGLANAEFNPDDPSSGLASYSRALARHTKSADDVINRNAAITGSRFGDSIGRDKVDLAERQSDLMGMKLGDLFNQQQNRSLQAAQGLGNLGAMQENAQMGRIGAGFQYGGLQRNLANAEAQAKYSEFNRQRDEELERIGIMQNVTQPVSYGVRSASYKPPSQFSGLLNSALGMVGSYFGSQGGGGISQGNQPGTGWFGGKFGGKTQTEILGYPTAQYR